MRVEWPTLGLIAACYGLWLAAMFLLPSLSLWVAIVMLTLSLVLHSSLQHEVTHGHPLPSRRLSEALVYPSLNLMVPFARFRDTHLAHHHDSNLTDPYDDPESNYLDPAVWARLPRFVRILLAANNTLLGRLTLGPALGQIAFLRSEWRMIRGGAWLVRRAWAGHLLAAGGILALVVLSPVPIWAYLVAAYAALALLKIRTFLEHQAHERARGRTVIIEDRGLLAFLFLNNNFHVVHHMHPRLPWYRLPQVYAANRERYLRQNEGYRYRSYGEIFGRYLWRAKDPVPHPLWPRN